MLIVESIIEQGITEFAEAELSAHIISEADDLLHSELVILSFLPVPSSIVFS